MNDPIKIWSGNVTRGQIKEWPSQASSSNQSSVTNVEIYIAGETLNAGMAIYMETDGNAYIYKSNIVIEEGRFLGVSTTSVSIGDKVIVVLSGKLENVGRGYVSGEIYYASPSGFPSTTIPTSGFQHQIGIGVDTDNLLVTNGVYIELS